MRQLEEGMTRISSLGRIANKSTTTGRYEREIDLDEQYVSGNEVELVLPTSITPAQRRDEAIPGTDGRDFQRG